MTNPTAALEVVPPPSRSTGDNAPTRRAISGWVLYDLANTIFSMGVVSLYLPMWLREQLGAGRTDLVWGVIQGVSYALILFVSPQLGAMTDRLGRRMPFLVASTTACIVLTALLARFDVLTTAILFVLANIAYQAGLQFYDALLPEVSTEENRGRIGGIGIGVGYLGAFFAVALSHVFGTEDKAFLFLVIAALFLLFSLPCFAFVKERRRPRRDPVFGVQAMIDSTRQTIRTLRSGKEYPGLMRFLVGRVFYADAINTVIGFMTLIAVNWAVATGLTEEAGELAATQIMGAAIVLAVIGGFVWGWTVDRLGPKKTLNIVLFAWIVGFTFGGIGAIAALPIPALYVVGGIAGFSMGGIWAADRPYMLRLTPPDRIGEFYGLYNMVGRFAAISGPLSWMAVFGVSTRWFGLAPHEAQGIAILVLVGQMVVSYLILRKVSDKPRAWGVDDRPPGPAAELAVGTTPRIP